MNLIGEHADCNGRFVLPCAINCPVATAIGSDPDGNGALFSADFDEICPLEASLKASEPTTLATIRFFLQITDLMKDKPRLESMSGG